MNFTLTTFTTVILIDKLPILIVILPKFLMMLKFIQSHFIIQVIVLVALLALAVLHLVNLTIPEMPDDALWIFNAHFLWQSSNVVKIILATLGILLFVILEDIYYFRCGFGDKHHFMVFIISLLLIVAGGIFTFLSPIGLVLLLTVIILMLNFNYDTGNVKSRDLFSGILIAVATLFYFPCIFLSFFVISSLIINKFSKAKDILAFCIGMLLVIIYLFCFYFFTDDIYGLLDPMSKLKLTNCFAATAAWTWREIVLLSVMSVTLLYAIIVDKISFETRPIALRKRLSTLNLMTISCLLMFIFSPFSIRRSVLFFFPPMVMYFSILSQMKKNRWMNDIIFVIFIIALCL